MILDETTFERDLPELPFNPVRDGALYRHQELLVRSCMAYELTQSPVEGIISNFGFIGEITGAGKTICSISIATALDGIKGRLRLDAKILPKNKGVLKKAQVDGSHYRPVETTKTLIIVPTGLAGQWDRELTRFSQLEHVFIDNSKTIKAFNIETDPRPVILCKSTMWSKFVGYNNNRNYVYARVFIDECDTINIANFPTPLADFYWFVSATCDTFSQNGMLRCKNTGFVRRTYDNFNEFMYEMGETAYCVGCLERDKRAREVYELMRHTAHPYAHCHICAIACAFTYYSDRFLPVQSVQPCRDTICGGPHLGGYCPKKRIVEILVKKKGKRMMRGEFSCETTNPPPFIIPGCYECRQAQHNKNITSAIDLVLFRTDPAYVKACLELESYREEFLECATPAYLAVANRLNGVLTDEIMRAINSGDILAAAERYGIKVNSGENIMAEIRRDMEGRVAKAERIIERERKIIDALEEEIARIRELIPSLAFEIRVEDLEVDDQVVYTKESKAVMEELKRARQNRTNAKNRIKTQEERIKSFQERLEKISAGIKGTTTCSICIDQPELPTLTSCCRSTFCFACINTWVVDQKKGSCPYCRAKIGPSDLETVCADASPEDDGLMSKEDTLRTLFSEGTLGEKVLIFTEQDGTIARLEEIMRELGISYIAYYKTSGGFTNIVRYLEGDVRVVLLNSVSHGAGLNMQVTSDVVLYHKMAPNLEFQAIGRAQRPGRKERLRLWRLAYNGEY